MKSVVVLLSGRGSNLHALLEAKLPIKIAAVISNNPQAAGLDIAKTYGIETLIVDHRTFPGRAAFDTGLTREIDHYQPDLIVLAGFMRILSDAFVTRYSGRMINIHPSLLPSFPGMNTHMQALRAGVKIHGCSVHFVTPKVDHGPIILQAAVPVLADDTEQTLAARVLQQEHVILPEAVRWFAEDRLDGTPNVGINLNNAALSHAYLRSPWETQ